MARELFLRDMEVCFVKLSFLKKNVGLHASENHFGVSWRLSKASWGAPGVLLGGPGGLMGASWGGPGAS